LGAKALPSFSILSYFN